MRQITWAVGMTTVPQRKKDLLGKTLASVYNGGFSDIRLFIDGCSHSDAIIYEKEFNCKITCRHPNILTYGNFCLGLAELYIRQPNCTYYAMLQDDFICYKNLRQYLERTIVPGPFYRNLLTFPANQERCPTIDGNQVIGWYQSNQMGRGAVALVFNHETVIKLLTSQHMVDRPMDAHRGHKSVDGGVVTALTKIGYREMVHNPSLVQHTGLKSSMGNRQHPLAPSFRGEDFDALDLLK